MVSRDSISFEYALTRPFNHRWPYATWFLIVFGLGSFVGFAVINHILLGYDVVAISSRDFNVSQNLPWPASFHARDYSCQPAHFQLGNAFRTNHSAFTYSIFNVYSGASSDTQGSFVYSNNLLSDCDVSEIQTNTLPAERSITITGAIRCPEQGFQASTSYTYTNHDIIGNSVQTSFSNNSMTRAIASAMADAGGDAYLAIFNSAYTFMQGNKVYRYTRQYATNCDASVSGAKTTNFTACDQHPANLTTTWDNVIGLTDLEIYPSSLLDNYTWIASTLDNLAQTFYAGVRIDLGHWTPNNIFTNFTSLKASFDPFDGTNQWAAAAIMHGEALGYVNYTANDTPSPDVRTPQAVIQTQYTCNTRRLKSIGSLIMSVASGTLSMFLTVWGLMTTMMATVARRSPGANICKECAIRRGQTMDLKRPTYLQSRQPILSPTAKDPLDEMIVEEWPSPGISKDRRYSTDNLLYNTR
ncbi:hypothetical protein PUNSTDRAFT_115580 [Punctularia strigosozonata HHB-11173 SS5]|uniref:uncharacterized protein n=1 Tax=Punctularia strigosozonata (strain HHB-11173) TaxID=741275 RepID=UPI0004417AB6|nr:uncharacterized protein PUNSTDRAFT_115580 [Punctularia strigosozonata HHB-11173 SS5]EIN06281.1 hypothetical protein PUNSTDRAFT_115580 [Punctularia strigosozonata HHB-11173 SS5]